MGRRGTLWNETSGEGGYAVMGDTSLHVVTRLFSLPLPQRRPDDEPNDRRPKNLEYSRAQSILKLKELIQEVIF